MDDVVKSPLIRGKPAWHVRFYRFFMLYMFVNVLLLIGLWWLLQWLASNESILFSYSVLMLAWVFGGQLWIARLLHGYGVSIWKMRDLLHTIEGVPCPSCLYPLCSLDDADEEYICPECGCGIRGTAAIRAWESLRGYEIPKNWGEAWERRVRVGVDDNDPV